MAFFRNLKQALSKKRIANPVLGSAKVISASMPPHQSGGKGMCEMRLVITIPNQPSVAVEDAQIVHLEKWPWPGVSLPIEAERDDPRVYNILWEQVPTNSDVALQQAQEIATQMSKDQATATWNIEQDSSNVSGLLASLNAANVQSMTGLVDSLKSSAPVNLPSILGSLSQANIATFKEFFKDSPSLSKTANFVSTDGPKIFTTSEVSINGRQASTQEIAELEKLLGMDINNDGKIGS